MRIILLLTIIFNIAAQNINELPLYGGVIKSTAQLEFDKKFIEEVLKLTNGNHIKAGQQLIYKGWEEILKQDTVTAIKRFNQAYLLDPENYEIYWGLGIATNLQGKFSESKKLFKRAFEINSRNGKLAADYVSSLLNMAASYLNSNNRTALTNILDEALKEATLAIRKFPNLSLLYLNRAKVHYYLKNETQAIQDLELAKKYGSTGLDPDFLKTLEKLN